MTVDFKRVDQCIHDAEHADSGAMMAGIMKDHEAQRHYLAKRSNLIDEAHNLDPHHTGDAWEETNLDRNLLPKPVSRSSDK